MNVSKDMFFVVGLWTLYAPACLVLWIASGTELLALLVALLLGLITICMYFLISPMKKEREISQKERKVSPEEAFRFIFREDKK